MPGILIIDDNTNMRRLLRSFIETNTGFEICGEAENGPEGIEKAKQLQPDLILLDLTLPGMSGTEAAPILKRLLPQVKIILFTMHADGVNQKLAATFNIDIAMAKTDSILALKDHLITLLMPVDSSTRAADLKRNTKINLADLALNRSTLGSAHTRFNVLFRLDQKLYLPLDTAVVGPVSPST